MGSNKVKSEGGQGGKLGHSNMHYWGSNDEVKDDARKQRWKDGKKIVENAKAELESNSASRSNQKKL